MGFSRFMKKLAEAGLDETLFEEALNQLKEAKPKRGVGLKRRVSRRNTVLRPLPNQGLEQTEP
jgi:hypothetical protein